MNTSTGQSKPMGLDKEKYREVQDIKAEEDFKYATFQKLQNLQFALEAMQDQLAKAEAKNASDIKDCEIQMHQIVDVCTETLKDFRGNFDVFERKNKEFSQWNKVFDARTKDCPTKFEFKTEITRLEKVIESLRLEKDSMRKEFNGLIERLKLEFDNKLKAQKEEILSMPSEVPNLKKMMEQKIELVELNGQNAVLRSSNNEKQIMLVERKIDNLYQLIKKLELANQESQ